MYYKVVRDDLKSLGMKPRGKQLSIIQYNIGKWTHPLEPICDDPDKGGGLWVHPNRASAFKIARYVWKEHKRKVRIFICFIGDTLCKPSSYREKTTKVKLFLEIPADFLYVEGGRYQKSNNEKIFEDGYGWKRVKVRCDNTISPGCGWEGRRIWRMKIFERPCPKCGETRTLFCPPRIVKE